MSATEFNARQLAVLAEARALGGWEIMAAGKVRSWIRGMMTCPAVAASGGLGSRLDCSTAEDLGLSVRGLRQITDAADDQTDPRRPALLAALGMEVSP
jgi:hypothetical protein